MRHCAGAVFCFGLVAGRHHFHDALDGFHSLLDDFVHLSGDRQALLRTDERDVEIDLGARLVGGRQQRRGASGADGAGKLEGADLGAPSAPSAFIHPFVEIGPRQPEHPGNVVDRRQCLFVKPPGFSQKFRRDFSFCDQDPLPIKKRAGKIRRVAICVKRRRSPPPDRSLKPRSNRPAFRRRSPPPRRC